MHLPIMVVAFCAVSMRVRSARSRCAEVRVHIGLHASHRWIRLHGRRIHVNTHFLHATRFLRVVARRMVGQMRDTFFVNPPVKRV